MYYEKLIEKCKANTQEEKSNNEVKKMRLNNHKKEIFAVVVLIFAIGLISFYCIASNFFKNKIKKLNANNHVQRVAKNIKFNPK